MDADTKESLKHDESREAIESLDDALEAAEREQTRYWIRRTLQHVLVEDDGGNASS